MIFSYNKCYVCPRDVEIYQLPSFTWQQLCPTTIYYHFRPPAVSRLLSRLFLGLGGGLFPFNLSPIFDPGFPYIINVVITRKAIILNWLSNLHGVAQLSGGDIVNLIDQFFPLVVRILIVLSPVGAIFLIEVKDWRLAPAAFSLFKSDIKHCTHRPIHLELRRAIVRLQKRSFSLYGEASDGLIPEWG